MTGNAGNAADLSALATLGKLVAHAFALSQSRTLAQRIVRDAAPRHPRPAAAPGDGHLDPLLAEIGRMAARVSPLRRDGPTATPAASAIAALPVGEREALSLHNLFGFGHGRIASIMGIDESEAAARVRRAEAAVGAALPA